VVFDYPAKVSGIKTPGMLEYPVIKDNKELMEIVDLSDDIINAPKQTVMSASSAV
jgi:hypothetical protein